MKFPRFWAKGVCQNFSSWRWSDESLSDAQSLAQGAAQKLAERFAGGNRPEGRYGYGDRPFREPVLRELKNDAGGIAAVVSRNSYGCLVLNTARAMFVDVDLPAPPPPRGGLFKKLFGWSDPAPAIDVAARVIAKAGEWAQARPDWGWRIYRTRAGLRLLATHALFDPAAVATEPVFDELNADPLYRKLCQTQKCFRARLTPKPWRCGLGNPPTRWPWPDAKAESRFKEWETRYLNACSELATCDLLVAMGNQEVHPEVQTAINLHDDATRAESGLALA